jgi:hypothetical protein
LILDLHSGKSFSLIFPLFSHILRKNKDESLL